MRRLPWVLALCVALLAGWLAAGDDKSEYVKLREVRLKDAPTSLAKALPGPLGYGTRVEILRKEGPWREVRLKDGKSGWLHETALSPRKVVLRSGAGDVVRNVTAEEGTGAIKGFSPEVEADYKSKHAEMAPQFDAVDRIGDPKGTLPIEEILRFLKEGGLKTR